MRTVIVFLALAAAVYGSQVRYDNCQVFRVTPTTERQVEHLRAIEQSPGAFSFWTSVVGVNKHVDIFVPPHMINEFKDLVNTLRLNSELFIEDVQKLIDAEKPRPTPKAMGWTDYYRLADIYGWLSDLSTANEHVTLLNAGKSYEGRDIMGVSVVFNPANKAIFIEGGIHAREWISPAVVTYMLNEILNSADPAVRALVEQFNWYVFPNYNPDGYEYTHTNQRLWRKTRKPYGGCYGADPNRNWGYHWMNGGASNNPCDETYAGPSAFSEPESVVMSNFVSTVADELVAYLGFHSYSQLVLIPYGDSPTHIPDYAFHKRVGDEAAAALARRYGTQYTVGNIVEVIYVASGGSMDWVKGTYNTPLALTYELRDTGRYGFILPPDQIYPSGLETFDSLLSILENLAALKK